MDLLCNSLNYYEVALLWLLKWLLILCLIKHFEIVLLVSLSIYLVPRENKSKIYHDLTWRTCLYCSSKLQPAALPSDEEDEAEPAGWAGGGGAGARNAGGAYGKPPVAPAPASANTLLGVDNGVPWASEASEDKCGCKDDFSDSKSSRTWWK